MNGVSDSQLDEIGRSCLDSSIHMEIFENLHRRCHCSAFEIVHLDRIAPRRVGSIAGSRIYLQ